jgi:hypothetical protein
MAGTRLIIHTIFVVQLFLLITTSYYYASTKHHGKFSSVEPFVIDRSGWSLLLEDVAPAGSVGLFARALSIGGAVIKTVGNLLGDEKRLSDRAKSSSFVEEMRRKLSQLELSTDRHHVKLPPLSIQIVMPQDNSKLHKLADALQKGIQKHSSLSLLISTDAESKPIASCDDFSPPSNSKYQAQMPQIVVLTDCLTTPGKSATVDIHRDVPIVIVRTKSSEEKEFERLLEEDIAHIILTEITKASHVTNERLSSLHLELIDEDPASHIGATDRVKTKRVFELLGNAFASSTKFLIQPLLDDLSFLYGGNVHVEVNSFSGSTIDDLNAARKAKEFIRLTTDVSAYLPLPGEMIETDKEEEDEPGAKKYISTEHVADWFGTRIATHQKSNSLHWALFVPSKDHSPLMIHVKSTEGEGVSVTLMNEFDSRLVSGLSIINLDPVYQEDEKDVTLNSMQLAFQHATSSALQYLVGYIRAFHGLSPLPGNVDKSPPALSVTYASTDLGFLSFWELEAIARNHWYSVLQRVLCETDALMALLYTHRSLAFTESIAYRLNNSTQLLRHSMALIEQGYPTQYATSALYGSLHHLESVTSDPDLMELPHFAIDHYLAVFSPLILPLLMPLVVGLVREIKRYRKLKRKHEEGSASC